MNFVRDRKSSPKNTSSTDLGLQATNADIAPFYDDKKYTSGQLSERRKQQVHLALTFRGLRLQKEQEERKVFEELETSHRVSTLISRFNKLESPSGSPSKVSPKPVKRVELSPPLSKIPVATRGDSSSLLSRKDSSDVPLVSVELSKNALRRKESGDSQKNSSPQSKSRSEKKGSQNTESKTAKSLVQSIDQVDIQKRVDDILQDPSSSPNSTLAPSSAAARSRRGSAFSDHSVETFSNHSVEIFSNHSVERTHDDESRQLFAQRRDSVTDSLSEKTSKKSKKEKKQKKKATIPTLSASFNQSTTRNHHRLTSFSVLDDDDDVFFDAIEQKFSKRGSILAVAQSYVPNSEIISPRAWNSEVKKKSAPEDLGHVIPPERRFRSQSAHRLNLPKMDFTTLSEDFKHQVLQKNPPSSVTQNPLTSEPRARSISLTAKERNRNQSVALQVPKPSQNPLPAHGRGEGEKPLLFDQKDLQRQIDNILNMTTPDSDQKSSQETLNLDQEANLTRVLLQPNANIKRQSMYRSESLRDFKPSKATSLDNKTRPDLTKTKKSKKTKNQKKNSPRSQPVPEGFVNLDVQQPQIEEKEREEKERQEKEREEKEREEKEREEKEREEKERQEKEREEKEREEKEREEKELIETEGSKKGKLEENEKLDRRGSEKGDSETEGEEFEEVEYKLEFLQGEDQQILQRLQEIRNKRTFSQKRSNTSVQREVRERLKEIKSKRQIPEETVAFPPQHKEYIQQKQEMIMMRLEALEKRKTPTSSDPPSLNTPIQTTPEAEVEEPHLSQGAEQDFNNDAREPAKQETRNDNFVQKNSQQSFDVDSTDEDDEPPPVQPPPFFDFEDLPEGPLEEDVPLREVPPLPTSSSFNEDMPPQRDAPSTPSLSPREKPPTPPPFDDSPEATLFDTQEDEPSSPAQPTAIENRNLFDELHRRESVPDFVKFTPKSPTDDALLDSEIKRIRKLKEISEKHRSKHSPKPNSSRKNSKSSGKITLEKEQEIVVARTMNEIAQVYQESAEEELRTWSSVPQIKLDWKIFLDTLPDDIDCSLALPLDLHYNCEVGHPDVSFPEDLWIEADAEFPFYSEFILPGDHENFFGISKTLGPIAVSIQNNKKRKDTKITKVLIRTKKADTRVGLIKRYEQNFPDPAEALKKLQQQVDSLRSVDFSPASKDSEIVLRLKLKSFETKLIVRHQKVGILCAQGTQWTEDQFLSNKTPTPAFQRFLDTIGTFVPLNGFQAFAGGLDVKATQSTGTHSYFTVLGEYQQMFHVSTLLPHNPHDPQQLEKKRHIGNDIVVIIFWESSARFDPKVIASHFNHVFIIVEPIEDPDEPQSDFYKLSVVCKGGFPPFSPHFPPNFLFKRGPAFREFLLAKCLNGETAAKQCVNFENLRQRTRNELLQEMVDLLPKKTGFFNLFKTK